VGEAVNLLAQLFYTFFKTLQGKEVIVELKNDVAIRGILHSVDHFLNVKLEKTSVVQAARFPQLVSARPQRAPLRAVITHLVADNAKDCVHPRFCCAVRAHPSHRGRHGAAAGRRAEAGAGNGCCLQGRGVKRSGIR
jgi:small nuclear ribonucleoprotein (snRNP)-like protein